MTAYLANNQKKKQTLARREADLLRGIERDAPLGKLLEAAEAVRNAQIRVFECQLSLVPPCDDFERNHVETIHNHIGEWRSLTAQDILRKYKE